MRIQKIVIVCLVVMLVAISTSGLALGQASPNFDLGCWGAFNTAGGTSQSANFRITDALGQLTAGGAVSPNAQLRIGYIQDWRTLQPAAPTPGPTATPSAVNTYLPIIGRYLSIIRSCAR